MVTDRLVEATDGNFYGTTWFGGDSGCGSVFRITRSGIVTVLHSFSDGADGAYPFGGLLIASDGNLYGTTTLECGFTNPGGTLFRLTPSGTLSVVHRFARDVEGGWPEGALIQADDGLLYGTLMLGGADGHSGYGGGSVFRASVEGDVTVLHRFPTALSTNMADPDVALVQATDGRMYGVASSGSNGGVFRLPRGPSARMEIDAPRAGESVAEPFVVSGWAFDRTAQFDAAIDTVHIWAYPAGGGNPIFVGASGFAGNRPDVAAVFGDQFALSGFSVTGRGLASGTLRRVHIDSWRPPTAVPGTSSTMRPHEPSPPQSRMHRGSRSPSIRRDLGRLSDQQ